MLIFSLPSSLGATPILDKKYAASFNESLCILTKKTNEIF